MLSSGYVGTQAELTDAQKVEAFLAYLELKNADMLRYHMQACGKLMDEAPLVRHVTREGGHMHDGHIHVGNPSEDERNLYLRPIVDRAGQLYRRRKKMAKKSKRRSSLNMLDVDRHLARAFKAYSTGRHRRGRGEPFMEKKGVLCMLRDCQLLDNKFTLLEASALIDKELGLASDVGTSGGAGTEAGALGGQALEDMSANGSANGAGPSSGAGGAKTHSGILAVQDVAQVLAAVAILKFPDAEVEDAVIRLHEIYVMPFTKHATAIDETLVQLFTEDVLAVIKSQAHVLKVVYSHYATLSLVSFHHSTWRAVRRANRALTVDEYVTFMLNFEVAPTLMNHHDIEDLFDKSNQNVLFQEDRLVWMNFSQFVESILRCSLRVADALEGKISSKNATITELNSFKKFVSHLPTEESRRHYTEVLDQRRKAVHDKVLTQRQTDLSPMGGRGSGRGGVGDDLTTTVWAGPPSPSSPLRRAGGGAHPDDDDDDDDTEDLKAFLLDKQKSLLVTFQSLKSFIEEDVAGPSGRTAVQIAEDLEMSRFEERLPQVTWKNPRDEMKAWKQTANQV